MEGIVCSGGGKWARGLRDGQEDLGGRGVDSKVKGPTNQEEKSVDHPMVDEGSNSEIRVHTPCSKCPTNSISKVCNSTLTVRKLRPDKIMVRN